MITVAVVHETAELFFKIYSVGDNGDDTPVGKLTVPVPLVKSCAEQWRALSEPSRAVRCGRAVFSLIARSFIAGRVGGDEGGTKTRIATRTTQTTVACSIVGRGSWYLSWPWTSRQFHLGTRGGVVTTDEDADGGDADEASGVSGKERRRCRRCRRRL